jgi:hypothetical protein
VWDAIADTTQQIASTRARSELMRSKIYLLSLDTLIDMAATAGINSTVKVSKPKPVPQDSAEGNPTLTMVHISVTVSHGSNLSDPVTAPITLRPLELPRVHHERIEAWILEHAGITVDPSAARAAGGRLKAAP